MNKDNFFPTEDYKIPETSNYMKFKQGTNKFRILSSAIVGYEYWNTSNKPIRSRTPFDELPADIKMVKSEKGELVPSKINHFWAFVIYNFDAKRIQVLELTQKGIMEYIQMLVSNPDWGSPKDYNITVVRKGTGLDTEYQSTASPHSQIDPNITSQYEKMGIDLEVLYEGKDPFKA